MCSLVLKDYSIKLDVKQFSGAQAFKLMFYAFGYRLMHWFKPVVSFCSENVYLLEQGAGVFLIDCTNVLC